MKLKYIRNFANKAIRPFKTMISRLFKISDDPKKIAYGFALGTFLGFTPFVGLQAAIAVIIASLLRWNKLSAGIAVYNTNIISGPFVFGISYFIGSSALGNSDKISFPDKISIAIFWDFMSRSYEIFLSLFIGGILLGIPASILAYYLSHFVVKNYRLRMASKQKNLMH